MAIALVQCHYYHSAQGHTPKKVKSARALALSLNWWDHKPGHYLASTCLVLSYE